MNYDNPLIRTSIFIIAIIASAAIVLSTPHAFFHLPLGYNGIMTYLFLAFIAGTAILTSYTALAAKSATSKERVETNLVETYAGIVLVISASTALLTAIQLAWPVQSTLIVFALSTAIIAGLTTPRFYNYLSQY